MTTKLLKELFLTNATTFQLSPSMPIDLVKMKNKIFLLAFYEQTYDIHWKTYFKNLTFLAKENKLKEFYLILYVLESTVNKY